MERGSIFNTNVELKSNDWCLLTMVLWVGFDFECFIEQKAQCGAKGSHGLKKTWILRKTFTKFAENFHFCDNNIYAKFAENFNCCNNTIVSKCAEKFYFCCELC